MGPYRAETGHVDMSENSGLKTLIVFSALFVACALGGAGYAGFLELRKQLDALNASTQRVVIDLSTELGGQIEKARWEPSGTKADNDEDQREIRETLAHIRTTIKTLSDRQTAINETLGKKRQVTLPQNNVRTVYFEMAKADGEEVDAQIDVALIGFSQYALRPDCAAIVNGYADTLGKDSANLALSRERARYVAAKIRDSGIEVARVRAWGERRLETHTFDDVDLRNNRRVEIKVSCEGPEHVQAQASS